MTNHQLPLVELHVHLEGAIPTQQISKLAEKNGVKLASDLIIDDKYHWQGFDQFLVAYDAACMVLVSREDFHTATYSYLAASAREGVIYCEIIISPTHAEQSGLGYPEYLAGIVAGCEQAEAEFGIVSRLIATIVRQEGAVAADKVIQLLQQHQHPLVRGLHIAGNEDFGQLADFKPYFRSAAELGLGLAAHAGEIRGPDEVRAAISELAVRRIGHGVTSIFDSALVQELAHQQVCLEVCPTSNICTAAHFTDYGSHPLRRLFDAGVAVTINSDDPPFFNTTIGNEYHIAASKFGFTRDELLGISRTAITHAFVESDVKQQLLHRINA